VGNRPGTLSGDKAQAPAPLVGRFTMSRREFEAREVGHLCPRHLSSPMLCNCRVVDRRGMAVLAPPRVVEFPSAQHVPAVEKRQPAVLRRAA